MVEGIITGIGAGPRGGDLLKIALVFRRAVTLQAAVTWTKNT